MLGNRSEAHMGIPAQHIQVSGEQLPGARVHLDPHKSAISISQVLPDAPSERKQRSQARIAACSTRQIIHNRNQSRQDSRGNKDLANLCLSYIFK